MLHAMALLKMLADKSVAVHAVVMLQFVENKASLPSGWQASLQLVQPTQQCLDSTGQLRISRPYVRGAAPGEVQHDVSCLLYLSCSLCFFRE